MWEERERTRAEILLAIDKTDASLGRGEGCTVTTCEQVAQLADDIKRSGMARLAAEDVKR